jgi:hypothetical protein
LTFWKEQERRLGLMDARAAPSAFVKVVNRRLIEALKTKKS